jgi:acetyl esterase/lipase
MPLGPGERVKLALLRVAMRIARFFARLRGDAAGVRSTRFRYGASRLEVGDVLDGPACDAEARTPVVFVHGGGWIIGHRALYARELGFLVEDGRPVANLDYPLAPEHPHPTPLLALMRALAWLRSEDARFERVHLMGDSAGGNLAVMLSLWLADPQHFAHWVEGANPDPGAYPEIVSAVSLYGVLDRLSWLEQGFPLARLMMQSYAGSAGFETEVGPELSFTPVDLDVRRGPPVWIGYGDADPLAESSRIGAQHLQEAGIDTEIVCYAGQGHGFFNFPKRPESQQLRSDVLQFLSDVEDAARASSPAELDAAVES